MVVAAATTGSSITRASVAASLARSDHADARATDRTRWDT
jgi:hypothetical protein